MIMNSYKIKVHGISFELRFKDNLTLIDGYSGIGKTMLFKQIRNDALVNHKNIVCLNKDNIDDLGTIDNILRAANNKLIFIDNVEIVLNMRNRLFVSRDRRNQYVIFTNTTKGYTPNEDSFTELEVDGNKGRLNFVLD